MKNVLLKIEYDGTNYNGWQIQKNSKTIQSEIQDKIKKLTGEDICLVASGRTDSGVHALGQVANFKTNSNIPAEKFKYALNSMLPNDIVIKESFEVDIGFNARYSAKGKRYRYIIYNADTPSAILRNYACFVKDKLDLKNMKIASEYFIGEHDFATFCSTGSSIRTTVRIVREATFKVFNNNIIFFEIEGNGFLYNMVRIIVGTLIEVGIGKKRHEEIPEIINKKEREFAGRTAPACGLYLVEVYY